MTEMTRRHNAAGAARIRPRSRAEVLRFFDGLDLIVPGLVTIGEWLGHDEGSLAGYGRVAIGFTGSATYDLLPSLARAPRAEFPGIDLLIAAIFVFHIRASVRETGC
ncbi:MAG TPA: SAM-dependent methyltransferase [Trebonia sp.]|jgi:hypothetical protein|nr:SAM-dependent methyltransferase [Trebonia sp.]